MKKEEFWEKGKAMPEFRTPEHYFENLPQRIMQRTEGQPEELREQQLQNIRWRWSLASLAIITASLVLIWQVVLAPKKQPDYLLASVSTADLVAYLQTTDHVFSNESEDYEALSASEAVEANWEETLPSDAASLEEALSDPLFSNDSSTKKNTP